jgi:two-component system, OmpR family, sensor kinase
MNLFKSIKWRLQLWYGLILVVVLAGFGFTAYEVARDNQLRRLDQELGQQLAKLFRPGPPVQNDGSPGGPPRDEPGPDRFRGDGPPGPEFRQNRIAGLIKQVEAFDGDQTNTYYLVIWKEDGSVPVRSPGAPLDVPLPAYNHTTNSFRSQGPNTFDNPPGPGPGGLSIARARGEYRELFREMPFGERLLIGRSMKPELAAMRRLLLWLFAAGAGVLALGLAGGWWVASRAIRPVTDISATAVKISAGDLSQRISTADTDSELGQLAGVLNSTFARLEAAFAQQRQFTSDAAHELRTPVSVMLTQTQVTLSRNRTATEYGATVEACHRSAQRMRRLIESLLELARLDAGQEPMKRLKFDLSQTARDGVELVRPLAVERNVKIQAELPPLDCVGDAERLGQVITNLLTNAIQYNQPGGEVRLATRRQNGTAVLTVTDTGRGIAAEDLPRVFERFYRGDKSRAVSSGNAGLGLAISKAIVEAHGGTIEVLSQPGAGTTFTVVLPAGG